ncbi:MAG: VCBS repeat-containing protein, partial [Gammaproteobacteria bacterium]|nr:VCBS repeat-containing protein [Gammaproteobacteria bacterium]
MFTPHWGKASLLSRLRRFFAAAGVACPVFLAAPFGIPVAQANHLPAPITLTTLIPFDDLLIPVPTPFHPDGVAKQADFNGDGRTDLLVQAPNGSGTSYLFLADANNKYTAITQSWNVSYLGLNWGADASTLYAGDYNGDGRADLIVESKAAGGRNGLIYSGPGGVMDTVYQTWDTPVPVGAAPTGLATNSTTAVDAITIFTLIPFDDLLIPVSVAFNPDGIRFKADLNGDGIADLFIQARNPGGSNYLLYGTRAADGTVKYTSIGQSWTDGHLGLNWNAQAVTLRVENGQITAWTGSGADQTVWRFTPDASGKITTIAQTWANAAGATAGSFDVTPTGAASYTIPITVPPGVNGMAPSLSLQYNSQSGNGLLGMGWNINGLSAIHRCPRTIAQQDSATGTVNFDTNDRFCLDGQRLMVVNGAAYGAVGAEYRTEIESFARVVSSGGTAGDPQSFTVYTKDGKIIEYGVTEDSRVQAEGKTQARVWAANKIRDRKNNAITIVYTENSTQGEYYPSRIDYPKGRSVQFTYEARTDDISGYMGGSKISITQRLAGIQTVVNMRGTDSVVRSYKLAYEQGTVTGRSRLASIQECTPSECLTPTRFGWQEGEKGFGAFASTGSGHAAKDELGDFNGDGKADIYQFANGAGSVWLSDGSGYPTSQAIGSGYLKEADGEQWLADINGDGRTDVISAYGLKSAWDTNSPLYSSTLKSRFWPAPQTATTAGMEFFAYSPDQQVAFTRSGVQVEIAAKQYNVGGGAADFDGDGKADVLWAKPIRNPSTLAATGLDWVVGYSTGSTAIDPIVTLSPSDTLSFVANGDFNGDGRTDLISSDGAVWFSTGRAFNKVKPQAPGEVPAGVNFSIGDFNGDGKADILYLGGNASSISIKLSTGVNFTDSGWSLGGITTSAAARKVADINGDGKSDIIEFGVDSAKVWLSTGKGFVAEQWGQKGNAVGDKLGDVNGDGRLDVINFSDGSAKVALAKGAAPDVLRTITNGLGARIEADYIAVQGNLVFAASSGANQIPNAFGPAYTINGTGASAPDFRYNFANSNVPLQVISKYSVSNGIGGMNTVAYTYGTSSIDRNGRGFLGFASITAVDKRAGLSDITTVTGYKQNFPFIGLVSSIQKKQDTALLYSVSNTWSSRSSDAKRDFPYISTSTEIKNDTNGTTNITTRRTTASYNLYGNPSAVSVTSSTSGVTVYTQSTGNEYYVNELTAVPATTEWHKIGQLKSSTATHIAPMLWDSGSTNSQGSSARTTEYTYYADGLLKDEILEPTNTLLKQTTTYGYDGFGNRISATVSGRANVADSASATLSRTSTTDYGPDGQFPVRAVNPAGHVATSVFDARFGTLTRLVDANGLATTRGYDSFGRLASEARPDGTQSAVSYNRCNYGCQGNDAYYVITTATGQPTMTVYYDMLGRETRRTTQGFNGGLVSKETQYDALGRTVYTARNHYQGDTAYATRYEYDALNRVTKETAPDNGVTGYAYNGLATTITNARNYKTTRYTNALGQLIRIQDAKLGNTYYDYDLFDNLRFIRDPASHDTVMTYNVRGHKTGMKDPDRGSLAWQTNTFGDIVKQTDAKGQVVTMDYDALGRMTKRTEAEGISQWTWDTAAQGRGKLAQATGPGGYKRIHTYDSLSRPVRVSSTLVGATYDIDTGYDQYGRIGSVGYPFTATDKRLTVYNSYTATGYLSEVKNAASGGTVYWKATGVDAEGRITQEALGNGLATTRSFDPLGRIKSIATGSNIQNLAYVYDATGNLTSRKDTVQNLTESFGYDELNRLTSVTGPAPKSYAYSADGNITAKSDMGDQYLYGET